MIITENINLNAVLQITDSEGIIKPAIAITSNLTKDGNNLILNVRTLDNTILESNLVEVQSQIDSFMNTLKTKMVELSYKITI